MAIDTPSVLVVEGESDLAARCATRLEDECDVRTVADGAAAVDAIGAAIDVVLLDRRGSDGADEAVLRTIRERDLDCRVAVIAAAEPALDGVESRVESCVDAVLVEPIAAAELERTVDRLALRSTYDDQLRTFFALAAKKALLDTEKTDAELAASQRYDALEDRLAVLRTRADETVAALLEVRDASRDGGGARDSVADE